MKKSVEEKVKQSLVNGKLPCAVALRIANELNVAPKVIGEAANELDIKIASCQLGCFP